MAAQNGKKIVVEENGPYIVYGDVPLVHKTQVTTQHGEPITWQKDKTYESDDGYALCRCGHSGNKPFCDGTHYGVDFDGTETAETDTFEERKVVFEGDGITVKRDYSICMESGFCGTRFTNIEKMMAETDDTHVRSQVIAMVERCPSGSYTYSIGDAPDAEFEPDMPVQIAVTTEMTDDGPIVGALWVTGYIPVERADGEPFETRNRVTLCRCGQSKKKPLCDGSHRFQNIKEEV